MASHIEGADERSTAASEFIETTAIDIYAVALQVRPDYLGGFLRLTGTEGAG